MKTNLFLVLSAFLLLLFDRAMWLVESGLQPGIEPGLSPTGQTTREFPPLLFFFLIVVVYQNLNQLILILVSIFIYFEFWPGWAISVAMRFLSFGKQGNSS